MKQTDSLPNKLSGTDWQSLGELEISNSTEAGNAVAIGISEIVRSLDMHPSFLNKVVISAQEAVARAMGGELATFGCEHVHILVYAPKENLSLGKTWGFFRIEKVGMVKDLETPDHSIEFYLYLEG